MTRVVEPPWLTAKVDQLLARMKAEGASTEAFAAMSPDVVMVFLVEPTDEAGAIDMERWEMTCDNCGKVTNQLHPGAVLRRAFGTKLQITFGVCPECAKTFEPHHKEDS